MLSGYYFYIGTIIVAIINLLNSKITVLLLSIIPGISLRLQHEGNWFCW